MKPHKIVDFLVLGNYLKNGSGFKNFDFAPNAISMKKNLVENYRKSFGSSPEEIIFAKNLNELDFSQSEILAKHFQSQKSVESLAIVHVPKFEHFEQKFDTSCTAFSFLSSFNGRWNFAFQDFFRNRRKFWKRLFFDPGTNLAFVETDKNGDNPTATIVAKLVDSPENLTDDLSDTLTLETIRMSDKSDLSEMLDPAKVRMVECRSFLNAGAAAILITSVKQRLFLKTTRLGKN
jgi:hypothetical protein